MQEDFQPAATELVDRILKPMTQVSSSALRKDLKHYPHALSEDSRWHPSPSMQLFSCKNDDLRWIFPDSENPAAISTPISRCGDVAELSNHGPLKTAVKGTCVSRDHIFPSRSGKGG